ncbi:hypothetical protein ACU8MW_08505 [Rhizobium leguminosarum]
MAADSSCKAREKEANASDDRHLWIDCLIAQKHVTLMIAAVPPFVAKDFAFANAGEFFAKATAGTEWSVFRDSVMFLGGPSFPGFEPFAQMRLIGRLCEAEKQCANEIGKIVDLKVLGTSSTTVFLIVMGDVEKKDYVVHGKTAATYQYFPDPISTMVETFNFATIPNPPY